MKRPQIVLVLVFTCLSTLSAIGQDVGFGIFAGPNFYTLRRDFQGDVIYAGSSAKQNLKYHVGAFADFNFSSELGLVANIVYQNRTVSLGEDVQLNYLEVNPLLKFDVNSSYGSGFYLKGGFRYSYLLSAKTVKEDVDVQDNFKTSNIGLVGGFGVDITNYMGLELLVDYSPMNIYNDIEAIAITSRLIGGNFRVLFYIEKIINTK